MSCCTDTGIVFQAVESELEKACSVSLVQILGMKNVQVLLVEERRQWDDVLGSNINMARQGTTQKTTKEHSVTTGHTYNKQTAETNKYICIK